MFFTYDFIESPKPPKKRIAFPMLNGNEIFDRDKIIYIKAESDMCSVFIVGREGAVMVNKSLKECEAELKDNDFVRIHRSYFINYDHLTKYIKGKGGIAIMLNKHELPVSEEKKKFLLEKMMWSVEETPVSHADSSVSHPGQAVSQVGA